ncbi:hypothetical protein ISN45_Aa01g016180 [Arabidopsis thaliana x Arabidopsis arenosa]|uniref:Uncharacterized protein n=1 Tax=Arabidopsis thaliana x Arabidopsis arenosa TaxID=1240361 RepID=A0A8T2C2W4_9BRAS|nr:hypothetical protein ISN45_Aa01g016180 [Arabidopsis thaliana x Arabidopsis arenosa]
MEVAFPSSPPAKCIGDDRLTMDFSKLGFPEEEEIKKLERSWSKLEESVEFNEDDEDEEEEEFSFACVNGEGSPITAEEAFEDGQIRPVFPLFNRDLLFDYENEDDKSDDVSVTDENRPRLRKLFVEDRNGDGDGEETEKEPLGPYCSWSGGTVAEASPETCRKSNSTGFSKLWRFRDLVLRSNSDGRDAFVFLNNNNNVGDKTRTRSSSSSSTAVEENDKKVVTEKKKGKEKTTETKKKTMTKSAHEKLYMRNRAMKEEVKHRSYLPYKQVGFFTNVNGLSRNIHPF